VSRGLLRRMHAFAVAWVVAPLALVGTPASAADRPTNTAWQGALLPRDSNDAKVFRGSLVFANYCVTCHGFNADGNGRAARL